MGSMNEMSYMKVLHHRAVTALSRFRLLGTIVLLLSGGILGSYLFGMLSSKNVGDKHVGGAIDSELVTTELDTSGQTKKHTTLSITTGKKVNQIQEQDTNAKRNIHREVMSNDIDVIWEAPGEEVDVHDYRGILFVAHGCSHSHTDFWAPTEEIGSNDNNFTCTECLGLPEELAIVRIAVDSFRLVVVAVSSDDRSSKCWNVEVDAPRVAMVLKTLHDRFTSTIATSSEGDLDDPTKSGVNNTFPMLAFGASSGGSFAPSLGHHMTKAGVHLTGFIAQLVAQKNAIHHTGHLQCAVYITMNRDRHHDMQAKSIVHELHNAYKIAAKHSRIAPLPVDENLFSSRISFISNKASDQMYQALLKNDRLFLSNPEAHDPDQSLQLLPDKHYLATDPRNDDEMEDSKQWRTVLRPFVSEELDTFNADESSVSEVMNVAFGLHEMTRDGVYDGLEFCLNSIEN